MITRRELLEHAGLGFGSLALASILTEEARPSDSRPSEQTDLPARAKRVIFLFMKGGPSQVDTFEYKPLLQRDHGKPLPFAKPKVSFAQTGNLLASPWKFKPYGECGHQVSELFPHVAKHVDNICFLHGVHGSNPAHGGAALKLHTGSDNFVRPSMGSWITYGLGTENAELPAFVTICPTLAHGGLNNWSAAFLPAHYQGTPIGNASIPSRDATVKFINNPKWSPAEQRLQLDLIKQLNLDHLETVTDSVLESRIRSYELAFRMQTAMPEIQDISGETRATRDLYGLDDPVTEDFGRQCLMARRFAERGVRFVQVTHSDNKVQWDQHGDLLTGHAEKAAEVDRPIAGLLHDLGARGLLKDTLVVWSGEFGRTPTVQGSNGRDHNPWGFTMWLAGGGVKGGISHGATDDYGFYAERDKMHLHDFHATLLALLGIDHEKLTYRHAGRDFRLTDVAGKVATEIFA
jgi:hypothetical protein